MHGAKRRALELDADRLAASVAPAYAAYGIRTFKDRTESHPAETPWQRWMDTHPTPAERIANLQRFQAEPGCA
jgi:Zn-dependent protease with chaperone function